jgi:UDP-N-acetylglucosamine acyltransferase
VGLRRRGFSVEKINEIQNVYRYFYQKGLNTTQAINAVETEMELSIEVLEILNFIKSSERGIIRGPND